MCKFVVMIQLCLLLASCGGGNDNSVTSQNSPSPCNASTGLRAPLPACSSASVCSRVAFELNLATIDTPGFTPSCDSAVWDERNTTTIQGFTRHACIRRPLSASGISPRPLLVWFHPGGGGNADVVASETQLLEKAASFDLTGDPARPGFILASVQGRNLRFPTAHPRDGQHHDFYYRDLNSPSTNPDIANVDELIDAIVQEGIVDTNRIYVVGWSNGGFFSQLYAIARHSTPTVGGNRVAAAAVFGTASPFGDVSWDPFSESDHQGFSCAIDIPASTVPILIVYRTSDATVACNDQHAACFLTEPAYNTGRWIDQARGAGIQMAGLRIGGVESSSPALLDTFALFCTDYSAACPVGDCVSEPFSDVCSSFTNHFLWPDGIYENISTNSGIDREKFS